MTRSVRLPDASFDMLVEIAKATGRPSASVLHSAVVAYHKAWKDGDPLALPSDGRAARAKWIKKPLRKAVVGDAVYIMMGQGALHRLYHNGDNEWLSGEMASTEVTMQIYRGDFIQFDKEQHWQLLPQAENVTWG